MSEFDKRFNYYMELFDNIPEDYSIFGKFGECCWADLISEGLVTSYPRDNVLNFLRGYKNSKFSLRVVNYPGNQDIEICLNPKLGNVEEFTKVLNKELEVFGYFVGKIGSVNHFNEYNVIIEPKYPTLLSDKDKLDAPFYHITHDFYLPKIQKIGLTPRESKTVFTHPGNRIYLLQTNDIGLLGKLKEELGRSKILKAKKSGVENSERFSAKNMIILEVEINGELYNDPMFPKSKNYNAVFTTQNIHPNNIR